FGPGVDEPLVQYTGLDTGSPSREWLHADERGSIVAHSDDAGARSALMAYDEFGMPAAAYPHIWQTTGQASLDHPRLKRRRLAAGNRLPNRFP
ncbi:MAG: RHS repeat-associated core domain-containing protein, partial [Pseudomonadota bacterium]